MSDEEKKSGGSNIMMPLIIVVVIIAAAGGWYYTQLSAPKEPVVAEPSYHQMEAVIVNLEDKNPRHYLKVEPILVSRNPDWEGKMDKYRPVLRNYLIDKLRKETVRSLSEPESYERVRTDLATGVKALIVESTGVDYIDDVVFSEFVVQ